MAFLDTFELVENMARPYITLRDRSITFSKTAIEMLEYTPFIHMYIDRPGKRVAFKVTEYDEDAIPFYKEPKKGRPVFVRISDKNKTKMILDLMDEQGSEKGIRIYGTYYAEEKIIGFDLSNIEMINFVK